jgi:hypothetical protein
LISEEPKGERFILLNRQSLHPRGVQDATIQKEETEKASCFPAKIVDIQAMQIELEV